MRQVVRDSVRDNRARSRRSAALLVSGCAIASALHGCQSPTAPPPPPGGGSQLILSFTEFSDTVEPVLSRQGCDAGGDCHGAGIRGTLELSPASAKDVRFDYDQVVLQVWAAPRDSSPILRQPLALTAGGTPHPYKPFATTADTDYQAIRTWVEHGVVR